jgi:DNA phosphorothioation-dependent restriction protein DptG
MKKPNYKLIEDNYYSSIEETEDDVDNYDVFKTLPQAKRKLIANMKQAIENYKRAIKRVKSITEQDLYGKTD